MESKGKNFGSGASDVEFKIKKAKNNVTVSMDSWIKDEEPSTPQVTADFDADNATIEYKKKDADDSTYTGTRPSEVGEYTVKAAIPEADNYLEGVATSDFEILEKKQKKYNVTFDPNGGTGMKEAESVDDNSSYTLPRADTFGVPKDKCSFKEWEVKIGSAEPAEMNPGDPFFVTADTTVKAVWNDEHAWGEPAYTWTDDNSAVTAKRVCSNNSDHEESETVKTTSVTKPATEDAEGKTTYTATFKNTAFTTKTKEVAIPKLVKVTFIGSAIDNDRVGEPYTIGIPNGSSIKDVASDLEDDYEEFIGQFTEKEYAPYKDDIYATPEPLSSYDSWSALEEDDQWETTITEDTELYFALWKEIDSIDLKVEKPVCSADMATGPNVSVKEGSPVKVSTSTNYPTQWWDKQSGQAIPTGQIEGGKSYTVKTYIRPEYGYFTDEGDTAPTVTVKNADAKGITYNKVSGSLAMIMFDVTVDHDWGEWTVTKKPTTSAEGEETRVCKHNAKHKETRAIPKVKPTSEPDPAPVAKKPYSIVKSKMTAKGKTGLTISWKKVKGVSGYDIFFARCNHHGKKIACKKVKNIKAGNVFKWTKSGLKKGTSYKAYIKAYVMKGGKKKYVSRSPWMHAYTGNGTKKYTNAKSVKVNKKKITLKKGRAFKIKGKVRKIKKNKKLFPKTHTPTLRYMSSDKKVATVSKKGKIKAKNPGTCYIYTYAHNGIAKTIKVTVK